MAQYAAKIVAVLPLTCGMKSTAGELHACWLSVVEAMELASHSDSDDGDLTKEPLEYDRDVLREDFERAQLLENPTNSNNHLGDDRRRERRRSRRRDRKERKKRRAKDGGGTLLYEMEEGGKDDASATSSRSSMEREAVPTQRRVCLSLSVPTHVY